MSSAFRLDAASAGKSKAAKMAMIAITTSSSMRVNPARPGFLAVLWWQFKIMPVVFRKL